MELLTRFEAVAIGWMDGSMDGLVGIRTVVGRDAGCSTMAFEVFFCQNVCGLRM